MTSLRSLSQQHQSLTSVVASPTSLQNSHHPNSLQSASKYQSISSASGPTNNNTNSEEVGNSNNNNNNGNGGARRGGGGGNSGGGSSIDDFVDNELKKWFKDFIDEVKKLRRKKKLQQLQQQQQQSASNVGIGGGMNASVTSSFANSHVAAGGAPYYYNSAVVVGNGGGARAGTSSSASASSSSSAPGTKPASSSAVPPLSGAAFGFFNNNPNDMMRAGGNTSPQAASLSTTTNMNRGGGGGMLAVVVGEHEDLLEATARANGIGGITTITSTETTPSSSPAAGGLSHQMLQHYHHHSGKLPPHHARTATAAPPPSSLSASSGGLGSAATASLPPPLICIDPMDGSDRTTSLTIASNETNGTNNNGSNTTNQSTATAAPPPAVTSDSTSQALMMMGPTNTLPRFNSGQDLIQLLPTDVVTGSAVGGGRGGDGGAAGQQQQHEQLTSPTAKITVSSPTPLSSARPFPTNDATNNTLAPNPNKGGLLSTGLGAGPNILATTNSLFDATTASQHPLNGTYSGGGLITPFAMSMVEGGGNTAITDSVGSGASVVPRQHLSNLRTNPAFAGTTNNITNQSTTSSSGATAAATATTSAATLVPNFSVPTANSNNNNNANSSHLAGIGGGIGGLSAMSAPLALGSARRTVSFLEGSRTEDPRAPAAGMGGGTASSSSTTAIGAGGNASVTSYTNGYNASGRDSVGLETKLGSAIREMSRKEIENSLEQAVRLIFELIKANAKAGGGSSGLAQAVGIGGGGAMDLASRRTSLGRKESMRSNFQNFANTGANKIAGGGASITSGALEKLQHQHRNNSLTSRSSVPLSSGSHPNSIKAGNASVASVFEKGVSGGGGGGGMMGDSGSGKFLANVPSPTNAAGVESSRTSSPRAGGASPRHRPTSASVGSMKNTNTNSNLFSQQQQSSGVVNIAGLNAISFEMSANVPSNPLSPSLAADPSSSSHNTSPHQQQQKQQQIPAAEAEEMQPQEDFHACVDDDFAEFEDQRARDRQARQAARMNALRRQREEMEEEEAANAADAAETDSTVSSNNAQEQEQLLNHARATARLVVTDSLDLDDLMGSASMDENELGAFVEHHNLKREKDRETGNIIINDFVVLGNLGQGAYGKVKLAHARDDPNKLVAIKIINKSLTKKRGAFQQGGASSSEMQIRREIAIMKKLRHKNIVSLHSVVDDPEAEKMYMVMDYIGGGTILKDETDPAKKREGFLYVPVPEATAVSYLRQLVDGLRHMHKHGIAHRDIKPANILLNNGRVYLSDFGVSELCDPEQDDCSSASPAIQPTRGPSFVSYSYMQAIDDKHSNQQQHASTKEKGNTTTHGLDAQKLSTPLRNAAPPTTTSTTAGGGGGPMRLDEDTNPFAHFAATPVGFGRSGNEVSTPTTPMRVKGHKGTPLFWPPEMFSSDPESEGFHNGEMQDLWALGVTLFMMLVGKAPFKATGFQDLRAEVTSPEMVEIPESLSPKARFLLRSMLNKDPEERPGLLDIRHHPFMGGYDKRSAVDRGSIFVYATELDEEDAITVTSGAVLPTHYLIAKVKPLLMRKIYRIREKQRLRREAAAAKTIAAADSNKESEEGGSPYSSPTIGNSNSGVITTATASKAITSTRDPTTTTTTAGRGGLTINPTAVSGGGGGGATSGATSYNSSPTNSARVNNNSITSVRTAQPQRSISPNSNQNNSATSPSTNTSQQHTPTEPTAAPSFSAHFVGGEQQLQQYCNGSSKGSGNIMDLVGVGGGEGGGGGPSLEKKQPSPSPPHSPKSPSNMNSNGINIHRSRPFLELPNLNAIDVYVTQDVGGGGGGLGGVGGLARSDSMQSEAQLQQQQQPQDAHGNNHHHQGGSSDNQHATADPLRGARMGGVGGGGGGGGGVTKQPQQPSPPANLLTAALRMSGGTSPGSAEIVSPTSSSNSTTAMKVRSPMSGVSSNPRRSSLGTTLNGTLGTSSSAAASLGGGGGGGSPTAAMTGTVRPRRVSLPSVAAAGGGPNNNPSSGVYASSSQPQASLANSQSLSNSETLSNAPPVSPSAPAPSGPLSSAVSPQSQQQVAPQPSSRLASLGVANGSGGIGGVGGGGGGVYENMRSLTAANPYAASSRIGFWRTGSSLSRSSTTTAAAAQQQHNNNTTNSGTNLPTTTTASGGGLGGVGGQAQVAEQQPSTPQRVPTTDGALSGSSPQPLRPPTPRGRVGSVSSSSGHASFPPNTTTAAAVSVGVGGGLGTRLPLPTASEQQQQQQHRGSLSLLSSSSNSNNNTTNAPLALTVTTSSPAAAVAAGPTASISSAAGGGGGGSPLFAPRPLNGNAAGAAPRGILSGGGGSLLTVPHGGGAYGSFTVGPRGLAAGNRLYGGGVGGLGLGGGGGVSNSNEGLPNVNVHMTHNFSNNYAPSSLASTPTPTTTSGGGGRALASLSPLGHTAPPARAHSSMPLPGLSSHPPHPQHRVGSLDSALSGAAAASPSSGVKPSPTLLNNSGNTNGGGGDAASPSSLSPASRVRNRLTNALFNANEDSY